MAPIGNSYANSELWPKTHYNVWREREVGLERGQWFGGSSGFGGGLVGEDEMMGLGGNSTYTSDELQVGRE